MGEKIKQLGNFVDQLMGVFVGSVPMRLVREKHYNSISKKYYTLFAERFLKDNEDRAILIKIPANIITIEYLMSLDSNIKNPDINIRRLNIPRLKLILPQWIKRGHVVQLESVIATNNEQFIEKYARLIWTGRDFIAPFRDVFDAEFPWRERRTFNYWRECFNVIYDIDFTNMNHEIVYSFAVGNNVILHIYSIKIDDTREIYACYLRGNSKRVIYVAFNECKFGDILKKHKSNNKDIFDKLTKFGKISDRNALINNTNPDFVNHADIFTWADI